MKSISARTLEIPFYLAKSDSVNEWSLCCCIRSELDAWLQIVLTQRSQRGFKVKTVKIELYLLLSIIKRPTTLSLYSCATRNKRIIMKRIFKICRKELSWTKVKLIHSIVMFNIFNWYVIMWYVCSILLCMYYNYINDLGCESSQHKLSIIIVTPASSTCLENKQDIGFYDKYT